MESMNNFRERIEALEQQMKVMGAHTRTVERRLRWWQGIACGLGLLGLVSLVPPSQAADFACAAGDVACLIEAINTANANGEKNTIRLEAGTYTLMAIDNAPPPPLDANGLPVIISTLTITGQGAETTIIERDASAPPFRILAVAAAGTLSLKRLTLRGGDSRFLGGGINNSGTLTLINCILTGNISFGGGGGLANEPGGLVTIAHTTIAQNFGSPGSFGAGGLLNNAGTVTITHSTFISNSADNGGGLTNELGGTVILTNTTVTENMGSTAGLSGGGIRNSGQLEITNSTVSHNSAGFGSGLRNEGTTVILNATIADNTSRIGASGAGIDTSGGTVILQNTILARNLAPVGPDCSGPVISLGNNLIGDPTNCTITLQPSDLTGDPGLDTFTDNGRPGNGHFPLLPTSQAIDAGSDAVCPRRDQLGQRRIGPCDIGAIRFLDEDDRQHEEDPAATAQESQ